jgi:hypothetical protein
LETTFFQSGFSFGKQEKVYWVLSPENRVDGAHRMSDVFPDNCGWDVYMSKHRGSRRTGDYRHKTAAVIVTLIHTKRKNNNECKIDAINCIYNYKALMPINHQWHI